MSKETTEYKVGTSNPTLTQEFVEKIEEKEPNSKAAKYFANLYVMGLLSSQEMLGYLPHVGIKPS